MFIYIVVTYNSVSKNHMQYEYISIPLCYLSFLMSLMFIKIQIHHNEQKLKLKVQHNFMEETKPYNIHKSKVYADFHFYSYL